MIATANTPGVDSSLLALFTQGLGAVSTAIQNSISTGRDRATMQAGQERTFFDTLQNDVANRFRKSENLQRAYENDRLFGLNVAKEQRNNFVTDRAFTYNAQQDAMDRSRQAEQDKLAALNTTTDNERAAKALELQSRGVQLGEVRTNLEMANILESRRAQDLQTKNTEALRTEARRDILASPSDTRLAPDDELRRYMSIFSGSTDPEVRGAGQMAAIELQTRNPEVDALTGKPVTERQFAPDRNNPYVAATTPQEIEKVATDIKLEIDDYERQLTTAKSQRVKADLAELIAKRREQLRKFTPTTILERIGGLKKEPEKMTPPVTPAAAPKGTNALNALF